MSIRPHPLQSHPPLPHLAYNPSHTFLAISLVTHPVSVLKLQPSTSASSSDPSLRSHKCYSPTSSATQRKLPKSHQTVRSLTDLAHPLPHRTGTTSDPPTRKKAQPLLHHIGELVKISKNAWCRECDMTMYHASTHRTRPAPSRRHF
jgi:hypothetical protein